MLIGGTFSSLLGGMVSFLDQRNLYSPLTVQGAARIVETLARTGGFAPKVGRKRLYATLLFLKQDLLISL